jgi:NAD(P)-dependent dehydrogenase (short-subunit alcohol dehydrogenase family)
MRTFAGKVAVVTGAASGIGFELAKIFAEEAMAVVMADVEEAALAHAVEALEAAGGRVLGVPTDVSKAEAVEAVAERAVQAFGAIHVACSNAGVFTGGQLWDASLADYEWLLGVNVWGVIHGIRSFVPRMIAQGDECHLVNTASMAALTALPYTGIYHMTKHAVLALSESLFHELRFAAPRVKVSCLCPELIATAIARAERNRPAELAGAAPSTSGELVRTAITEGTARGMPPRLIAERTLQAIREERFYILAEDAWREAALLRCEDIRLGRNPSFAPPATP